MEIRRRLGTLPRKKACSSLMSVVLCPSLAQAVVQYDCGGVDACLHLKTINYINLRYRTTQIEKDD